MDSDWCWLMLIDADWYWLIWHQKEHYIFPILQKLTHMSEHTLGCANVICMLVMLVDNLSMHLFCLFCSEDLSWADFHRKLQLISLSSWLSGECEESVKPPCTYCTTLDIHIYLLYLQVGWWSPYPTSHPRASKGEALPALLAGDFDFNTFQCTFQKMLSKGKVEKMKTNQRRKNSLITKTLQSQN